MKKLNAHVYYNDISQPVGAGFHACPTTEVSKKINATIAFINNAEKTRNSKK